MPFGSGYNVFIAVVASEGLETPFGEHPDLWVFRADSW